MVVVVVVFVVVVCVVVMTMNVYENGDDFNHNMSDLGIRHSCDVIFTHALHRGVRETAVSGAHLQTQTQTQTKTQTHWH